VKELQALHDTVAHLRGPEGCPWDRAQTHASLLSCLIEETSEVLEAVDREDHEHLCEELGDLLLSVFLHAQIAAEAGRFDIEDVARSIREKLVRRHPHVFGEQAGQISLDQLHEQWDRIKREEKTARGEAPEQGPFKELPPRLPALYHAKEVAKRFRKHPLPTTPSYDPNANPEAESVDSPESLGRRLFHLAALCDTQGWDPEALLRAYTDQVRHEATPPPA
jgi:XTP/dITP diphosphohydrolase/tetrapyrrole methylase family protein/MazG family protein